MRRAVIVLAAAVVTLVLAAHCLAQDVSTGAIHGTVFDPSIRRIAGASVALVNSATGFRYQQPTNGRGQFAFELLPPGVNAIVSCFPGCTNPARSTEARAGSEKFSRAGKIPESSLQAAGVR